MLRAQRACIRLLEAGVNACARRLAACAGGLTRPVRSPALEPHVFHLYITVLTSRNVSRPTPRMPALVSRAPPSRSKLPCPARSQAKT